MSTPDHVTRLMDQWAVERPDLDVSPMGVIGRLHRLAERLDAGLDEVYSAHGLGHGEFDTLCALRRAGEPFQLTPGEIAATSMVTAGATSKRVEKLLSAGLVEREACADDRRVRRVRLTDAGRDLIDRAFTEHVANEHRLLSGLTSGQRADLADLLERWSRSLDV